MWLLLLALPAAPAGAVKIERMSPPPLNLEVSLPGTSPSISADGRFVAFLAGEGSYPDIYVRDRQTGKSEWISATASGAPAWWYSYSSTPAISADGRFIAFVSSVNTLVPEDTDGVADIFVRDRQTGKTELVSVAAAADRGEVYWFPSPAISADGRFVAFLAGEDTMNIAVRDRQTGTTERVSVSNSGEPANGWCFSPSISADGRFVTFWSGASNLVMGDTNGAPDIFVRDRQAGKTEMVSAGTRGEPTNGGSYFPAISADGRFIAFQSDATNLVAGDTSGGLFVRDRQSGRTERVGDGNSLSISADGRFVAFENGDIYVRDRQTGTTERVAVGNLPSISADGRFVAFGSDADNLAPGDRNGTPDVFVRDRVAATTGVITATVNVRQAPLDSDQPAISADGQWVVFVTEGQLFERNRLTGAAALVSATAGGAPANGDSGFPSISADGRFIAFGSRATDLVPGETRGGLFIRDRQTGKTERVSDGGSRTTLSADGRFIAFDGVSVLDLQTGKTESIGPGFSPSISADGRFVAFQSDADNLVPGDTNKHSDIFVRDRQTGKTERVSVTATGAQADWISSSPSISADGRFVAFEVEDGEIYLWDRQIGKTEMVSVPADGRPFPSGHCFSASISGDGRFVAFRSRASNLVPNDTNGQEDVFVRDRQAGKTEILSVSASGAQANGPSVSSPFMPSRSPVISGDGRFVAFVSYADNLVPGDTNGKLDVFVAERE